MMSSYNVEGLIMWCKLRSVSVAVIASVAFFLGVAFACPPAGSGDIISNLIGLWAFDADSGNTVVDASASGANGTLAGTTLPTHVAGHVGTQALSFSQGYVDLAKPASLNLSGNATLAAWINPASVSGGYQAILSNYNTAGNNSQFSFYLLDSRISVVWENASGVTEWITTGITLVPNTWYHVVVAREANNVSLYINSQQQATTTPTNIVTPDVQANVGSQSIGRSGSADEGYFVGVIDDARIYSRALTQADVIKLYAIR